MEQYQLDFGGLTFDVKIEQDMANTFPWVDCAGFGTIERVSTPWHGNIPKKPSQIVLFKGGWRHYSYLYDVQASQKKAIVEHWEVNPDRKLPAGLSEKQIAAICVRDDIAYCKKWLKGDISYVVVSVSCGDFIDTMGGVEYDIYDSTYIKQTVQSMVEELFKQIKGE